MKNIFLICFLIISCFGLQAQLSISWPVERAVFQRVNNKSNIGIIGSAPGATQAFAQANAIQGGNSTGWVEIGIANGQIQGSIKDVNAGWYELQVRVLPSGEIRTISKIGVGEVFVIAGQSNAQGGRSDSDGGFVNPTRFGAMDDRVNCLNFMDNTQNNDPALGSFSFSHLDANSYVGPSGKASWCWGVLGDKLASHWNVPILFLNAAQGATTVNQWTNASNNEAVWDEYSSSYQHLGWPYTYLKKSITWYRNKLGIRAILWHQGENDFFLTSSLADRMNYENKLKTLIENSRNQSGKNITWMVAKVSRVGDSVNEYLKESQQNVINSTANVFQGPDTDLIQPSASLRDATVHFSGDGLVELADAWKNYIVTDSFTYNSNPILPDFIENNILPLKLISFVVNKNEMNEKHIRWEISDVSEMQSIQLEKSNNGKQFTELLRQELSNNSEVQNFQHIDYEQDKGVVYYRLKYVEKTGKTEYSKIISLKMNNPELQFKVFPNPASEYISLQGELEGESDISIFNLEGKKMASLKVSNSKPLKTVNIADLPKGNYILSFYNGIINKSLKFIKE
jgi:RNA binding exosome subunit